MSNMDAQPKDVAHIFGEKAKFKIPVFQRDYSWKMENWRELWNDIINGFHEQNQHYLGSIVLVDNEKYKEVLDGQQRLTTLSIIIKAIHWHIKELIKNKIDIESNTKRLSKISQLIFEEDLYNLDNVSNRVVLNDTNDRCYSKYIVQDFDDSGITYDSKSNELLVNCYKYYKNKIKDECRDNETGYIDIKLLLDYFKYITESIIVVEIVVSDYSNAYIIFETLNDRGLELTVTDLLKNYLFSKASSEEHVSMNSIWSKIITRVGEKNITKYIRHYWNSKNPKVTEKELFKVLKKYIDNGVDVKEFLNDLEEVSKIYSAISNPNNQIWNSDVELMKFLEEIKLYKVDLCYPVILATQLFIKDIKLKRNLFKLCSRISFRYIIICNGSAGDLESAYNKLCLKIYKEKDELNFNEVKNIMKEFIVPKEEFIASFNNRTLKTRSYKKIILEILKAVERNLGGNIIEDHTIEHILPEAPTNDWEEIFNNTCEYYKYRIGNYILLEREFNSEIGNGNFENKVIKYKDSSFKMTQNIANLNKWDIDSINKRQKEMAIIVENIWSI